MDGGGYSNFVLPVYLSKDGASLHPGARKHSLQYDGRPDGMMMMIGTIDAMFIFGRLQEVYHAKGKGCMCFVDLEKYFDRVMWKVLGWAMRKK